MRRCGNHELDCIGLLAKSHYFVHCQGPGAQSIRYKHFYITKLKSWPIFKEQAHRTSITVQKVFNERKTTQMRCTQSNIKYD